VKSNTNIDGDNNVLEQTIELELIENVEEVTPKKKKVQKEAKFSFLLYCLLAKFPIESISKKEVKVIHKTIKFFLHGFDYLSD
jgi:hypothetical protein